MTSEQLAAIAGLILSLAFSYIPGLSSRYNKLDPTQKRLVMVVLLLAATVGAFGSSCGGLTSITTCDKAGAWKLLNVFIAALVANQGAFLLSPRKATN